MTHTLAYLLIGMAAGLLAGLLGVGGGIVIVPLLALTFAARHLPPEHVHHLALGTSLATIVLTAIASSLTHHRHGVVDWRAVRRIAPGIVLGTLAGTVLAARLSGEALRGIFAVFIGGVAIQLMLDYRPAPARALPGLGGLTAAGAGIGLLSSLVGIGGGTLSVPFLLRCNFTIHRAIGTSAAIGLPIAVAGAAGYLIAGLRAAGLPAGAVGYIYLPALAGVALASVCTAPLGARLTHRLPTRPLRRVFAIFLVVVAVRMLLR